jgi:hypothetical protein
MAKRQILLATPGEILLEEFLKPLGVTQYRLAKEIGVPQRRTGKSSPASAASPPIPPRAWASSSAWKPSSG